MSDLIKLDDICTELFGIKPIIARRKAVLGQLPVPAFRLNDARKGPFLVRKSDIDALIQKRHGDASKLQARMEGVS